MALIINVNIGYSRLLNQDIKSIMIDRLLRINNRNIIILKEYLSGEINCINIADEKIFEFCSYSRNKIWDDK